MDQTKRTDGRTEPPASTLAFGKLVDSAKNLQESCKHRQDLQLWTWNSVELCLCVWDRRRKRKKKYKQETHPACLGRRIVGDAGISLTRVSNQSRSDFLFNFISYFLGFFVFFKLYFCTTMHTHTLTCALFFMMGRTEEEREDAALQQSDIVPVCFLYSGGFTDKQLLLLFGGLTCRREKHLAFGCWNKKINVSMLYPMNSEAFEFLCVWRQQTNVSGDWKVKKKEGRLGAALQILLQNNKTLLWTSWQESSVSEQAYHLMCWKPQYTVQIIKLKLKRKKNQQKVFIGWQWEHNC